MKNLILIFLLIPIIGFAQNKKELKKRIVQKNDSIIVFINQIEKLDSKVETIENENAAFEGDIRKLLKKISDEQEKNEGLNHNLNNQDTEIKVLSSSIMELTNEIDSLILQNSDNLQKIENLNEQLKLRSEDDSLLMYLPAVFHSLEIEDDSGGEYDITSIIAVTGKGESTQEISSTVIELPENFTLKPAYPNPFNPTTTLELAIPERGYVSVKVYNLVGQEVATLVDGVIDANPSYTFQWNAGSLSSGIYLVRAEGAGQVTTQKLMLLK